MRRVRRQLVLAYLTVGAGRRRRWADRFCVDRIAGGQRHAPLVPALAALQRWLGSWRAIGT
jgi:hypothetical protein